MRFNFFTERMTYLARRGWRAVGLDTSYPPGTQYFLLAFDDGYETVYSIVFPFLADLGWQAVVFVPSAYVGRWNDWDHQLLGRRAKHLTAPALRELAATGWTVGSHGLNHISLIGLSTDDLRRELVDSRMKLEDLAGTSVRWVSFPFGRFDQRVIDAAAEAGYVGAVVPWLKPHIVSEGFLLHRVPSVYPWDGGRTVERLLVGEGQGERRWGLRRLAYHLNFGTVLWKKLFSSGYAS